MQIKKTIATLKTESSVVADGMENCVVLRKVELVNGSFADIGERINYETIKTTLGRVELIRLGVIKEIE